MTKVSIDLDKLDYSQYHGGLSWEAYNNLPSATAMEISSRHRAYEREQERIGKEKAREVIKAVTLDDLYNILANVDRPLDTGQVLTACFEDHHLASYATNSAVATKLNALLEQGRIVQGKGRELRERWERKRVGFACSDDRSWYWWTPENGVKWDLLQQTETEAAKLRWDQYARAVKHLQDVKLIDSPKGLFYDDDAEPTDKVSVPHDLFLKLVAQAR